MPWTSTLVEKYPSKLNKGEETKLWAFVAIVVKCFHGSKAWIAINVPLFQEEDNLWAQYSYLKSLVESNVTITLKKSSPKTNHKSTTWESKLKCVPVDSV